MKVTFKPIWASIKDFLSNVTVEPCCFLFLMSEMVSGLVREDLYIQKVCKVDFNISSEICEDLQQHDTEQVQVQKTVSTLKIYHGVLSAVPALIFTLLAGPWSDIFGRKPLLMASIIGQLLGNLYLLACSYWFHEMPSDLILISTIGYYLGGLHCFSMLAHSMLTDVTDLKVRTKRIVLLGGCYRVGVLAGQTAGAAVKKTWGFIPSFTMAALISILSFLYALIFVKDAKKSDVKQSDDKDTEKKSKCKVISTFFDCRGLVKSFKCLFLKRSDSKRFCLLITAICFGLENFVETGGFTYLYLYLRKIIDMDLVGYAIFRNVSLVFSLLVQFLLVPILSGKFGVRDSMISMLDAATCVVQNIILALAFHVWMVYLSIFVAVLDAVSFSIIRSIVTKIIEPDEVGKVLSLLAVFAHLTSVVSSSAFGVIYRGTLEDAPSTIYYIIAATYFVYALLMFIVDYKIRKMNTNEKIEKVEEQKEG